MSKKLSVVIPAYNEEDRITATLSDANNYLKTQDYDYEIIVVDNGSRDKTVDTVKALASSMPNLRVLEQPPIVPGNNKGNAVKKGILESIGEYVVFMDADNATPISEIQKFWPYLENGTEVVIGSRYQDPSSVKIRQPLYKVILSRMANLLIQIVLIPHIKDTQCGFKAFRSSAGKEIFKNISIYGWAFDMELLAIALKFGYRIKEVPVSWEEHGGSHVPLKAYIQSLLSLFVIKWRLLRGKYSP
ncbi:MAG TPA: dolichyl-phosphate beta-glucosyltransferase [Patescibacteria group bacterium]|nr:dolichyl-phosphate beta-glucosyltransferase [Patescibacteria group bacterium]